MVWNPHPTITDGDAWSAADQNAYVKGNLDTLFPYTGGQQVAYSTSTASLNKAIAQAGTFLRSNITNTAIEFGAIVYQRQGNSTASWFSTSTSTTLTNITPPNSIFQGGNFSVSAASTTTIYFPQSYGTVPLVFVQTNGTLPQNYFTVTTITTSNFKFVSSTTTPSFPVPVTWFSIGEI